MQNAKRKTTETDVAMEVGRKEAAEIWQSCIAEEMKQRGLEEDMWNGRDGWRVGIGRHGTLLADINRTCLNSLTCFSLR